MSAPILYLSEGDAETWESLSGASRSLIRALRAAGREVRTGDVEVRGPLDIANKLVEFHPDRARWVERYHTGLPGFILRSRKARALLASHPRGAPVIQAGATFSCGDRRPRYCFCDANAAFAIRGDAFSPLQHLTEGERQRVLDRERNVYASADGIFTFTEGLRQSFLKDFGVAPGKVITTYAGPNLEQPPTDEDIATPKHAQPTILFMGKQYERKGLPVLIEAFPKVRAAIPDARLVIAGARPPLPPMDGVEVLGFVPRQQAGGDSIKKLFLTSDVMCLPSRYEPFGAVFCEAMTHGLACVGPRKWMSEIIAEGKTGWLVSQDDPEELAAALIEALSNRERTRQMGLAGRARALEIFNWTRVARLIIERLDADARR